MAVSTRKARLDDAPQIARLFYQTVHEVTARDYRPAQLEAWAPCIYPDSHWRRRLRRYTVFVVEDEGGVIAFGELDGNSGYIDGFFVDARRQRRGIGKRLLNALEKEARRRHLPRLFADVSITAEPFFRRMGFRRERRIKKLYRGQVFRQHAMCKCL